MAKSNDFTLNLINSAVTELGKSVQQNAQTASLIAEPRAGAAAAHFHCERLAGPGNSLTGKGLVCSLQLQEAVCFDSQIFPAGNQSVI